LRECEPCSAESYIVEEVWGLERRIDSEEKKGDEKDISCQEDEFTCRQTKCETLERPKECKGGTETSRSIEDAFVHLLLYPLVAMCAMAIGPSQR
jgi:hypothetical protein